MPRRRVIAKRQIIPDPKYGSETLAKFINVVMKRGKKAVAEKIVYGALDMVAERTKKDPVEVFTQGARLGGFDSRPKLRDRIPDDSRFVLVTPLGLSIALESPSLRELKDRASEFVGSKRLVQATRAEFVRVKPLKLLALLHVRRRTSCAPRSAFPLRWTRPTVR